MTHIMLEVYVSRLDPAFTVLGPILVEIHTRYYFGFDVYIY